MRILLIEDDERLSKSIPETLRSAGHVVDVAPDRMTGEECDASAPKIFSVLRFHLHFILHRYLCPHI